MENKAEQIDRIVEHMKSTRALLATLERNLRELVLEAGETVETPTVKLTYRSTSRKCDYRAIAKEAGIDLAPFMQTKPNYTAAVKFHQGSLDPAIVEAHTVDNGPQVSISLKDDK